MINEYFLILKNVLEEINDPLFYVDGPPSVYAILRDVCAEYYEPDSEVELDLKSLLNMKAYELLWSSFNTGSRGIIVAAPPMNKLEARKVVGHCLHDLVAIGNRAMTPHVRNEIMTEWVKFKVSTLTPRMMHYPLTIVR